jgi:cytosine/adenosine deaminase-related metal-dependent hydrolase
MLRPSCRRPQGCLLALFLALSAHTQQHPVALTGTLVTPDEVIPDGTVLIEHGLIREVGAHVGLPAGTTVMNTGGIIAPGLIDLHNHLTWNVFPRWKPIEEFGSRYDWQQKPVYNVLMTAPHRALIDEGFECDAERYAEVKAITEGETSVVGGSATHPECNRGLARNLDDPSELNAAPGLTGAAHGPVLYNVFPLQMTQDEVAAAKKALDAHGALLIHLAEGAPNDASAAREFMMLKGRGLLVPGVSFIHAVALKPDNFQEMKSASVGFIWSPRSNIELYGGTANVVAALRAGVTTALAPDWSPTGSDGLLGELQYAATWVAAQLPAPAPPPAPPPQPILTDHQLFDMATLSAASLVHLDHHLGAIEKNAAADLLVLRRQAGQPPANPWWSLDHASPEDVELVIIGGEPVYGDPAPMRQLAGSAPLEPLTICGAEKRISFASELQPQPSFSETETRLQTALREWGRNLAPLAECTQ